MKRHAVRKYLIAGLLVWLPITATFVVIRFLVGTLDRTLSFLPKAYQPGVLLGYDIPGLGVILSILVVFITGMVATNYFGKHLLALGESVLARIPLVRSIYHAVKQVVETIFSSSSDAFKRVMLVEYPRKGMWSIAFQTSTISPKIRNVVDEDLITIFIPTTPNPTSGYLIMIPRKDAIELELTIDEALKVVISLGVMQPGVDRPVIEH